MFELNEYRIDYNNQEKYFLLSNDRDSKQEFVFKVREIFIYENKLMTFLEDYIKPFIVMLSKNKTIEYYENPKTDKELNTNHTLEALLLSILNFLYFNNVPIDKYKDILDILDSGDDEAKRKLALVIYRIYDEQYSKEKYDNTYKIAKELKEDKNRFGQYNFNDYNATITKLFDI